MTLDAKVPSGPVQEKWDRHRFELKLVNPANKRKFEVIMVGTGLAGGAVPTRPGLVVVLTRMNSVEIDEANATAWVGPGVINLDLSKQTDPLGYHFAPDPSSQSACTIGGNVAMNSGGPHCLKHGVTTDHVAALEMILPDGTPIVVGRGEDGGLDLAGVFVGSEGTLGVITGAVLKLVETPKAYATAMVAVPTKVKITRLNMASVVAVRPLEATG